MSSEFLALERNVILFPRYKVATSVLPWLPIFFLYFIFSMSMARGPMLGAIAPHVPSAQRATFLSMLCLSGRAAFSMALATLSLLVVGKEALNWPAHEKV